MPLRSPGTHRIGDTFCVKKILGATAIAFLIAGIPVAHARSPDPALRTEVPIRQTTLSDGTIRYWLPVKIGGTIVDALLDTGTTGLRILPSAIPGADTTNGPKNHVSFVSGTEFSGNVARGMIELGGLSGASTFQLIETIKCSVSLSNCSTPQALLDKYKIGADGLPDEGFQALIGIKMGPSDIDNPLIAIGAKQWIVELPRPGADTPGRLVLNPRDDEIAGFAFVPLLAHFQNNHPLHDAVRGCIRKVNSRGKACGAVTFDTGYPAVDVINAPIGLRLGLKGGVWAEDTNVELTIFDGINARAVASFEVQKANASRVFLTRHGFSNTLIFAGVVPYLAFDIFYDPDRSEIGLKPRAIVSGVANGRLVQ